MKNLKEYDAIVVGGGHAGIEAVFALSKKGKSVALITLYKDKLASLPCNPSIGGPAKGIITREIDALGGVQGYFADKATIQIKTLNTSKGPAVRALRAQIDKDKYSEIILEEVLKNDNITIIEDIVQDLIIENENIQGVKTEKNGLIKSSKVILTTGTYMDSKILRGMESTSSGPDGDITTSLLSKSLIKNGINLIRLKTGTPCRVYSDSINFDEIEEEVLPEETLSFSFETKEKLRSQIHCWLTYTNEETHNIIRNNLEKSSMYGGMINGVGPRYCPSIEDKIVRFPDKLRHQVFFEPETARQDIYYINGISTSMPIDVQDLFIRTIPGLKNARIQKYGYAIEYDAVESFQITKTLESNKINGLYFAGQINGTSGYEEAAAQGLIAGINAALSLDNEEPLIISRDKAYIGVLIDDITLKGVTEPYRMLTSRAEYRLLLRNDNADIRLLHYAKKTGMISQKRFKEVEDKYSKITNKINELKNIYISSKDPIAKKYNIENGQSIERILARYDVDYNDLINDFEFKEEMIIQIRLEGYITKQETMARKMHNLEKLQIPSHINYDDVINLANEAKQKFIKHRPRNIGEASRISGVNPSDIEMLIFYLNTKGKSI